MVAFGQMIQHVRVLFIEVDKNGSVMETREKKPHKGTLLKV